MADTVQQLLIQLKASEIKAMVKRRVKALITREIQTRPPCIVGHAGIGKSEIVRQVALEMTQDEEFMAWMHENAHIFYPNHTKSDARKLLKEHGIRCVTTNLQFCEPPDFLGLPFVSGELGKEVTRHARPELLPFDGVGIWFLDEANRCSRDNRAGMLTLIQDLAVNGHRLGAGWMIVMAQNPADKDYEVQEFDAALKDRISPIEFAGDSKEVISYLSEKYTTKDPIVRWITNNAERIDFTGSSRTSPRGLEFCIKALRAEGVLTENKAGALFFSNFELAFTVMATELGQEAATAIKTFLTSVEDLKGEEVLDKWTEDTKRKIHAVEDNGRTDILNSLNDAIVTILSQRMETIEVEVDQAKGKVSGKNKRKFTSMMDNLIQYLETSAFDYRSAFFLSAAETLGQEKYNKIGDYIVARSPDIVKYLEDVEIEDFLDEDDKKEEVTEEEAK